MESATTTECRPSSHLTAEPLRAGRSAEMALVAIFLGIVGSVPLFQTAVELRRGEPVGALEVFRQRPTSVNLRAYEDSLEEVSVVARALRPWFQYSQFAWFGDGAEKALVGRDGWLFYKPGFDDMLARGKTSAGADAAAAIVAFRDALAAREIRLLVVVAPNKESVYPDRLTRRVSGRAGVVAPPTRDLLARLTAAGVEHVDLFALFASARAQPGDVESVPLYLAQDSHWSPAGVELTAAAVARRLVENGWISPGQATYRTRPAPVERLGDVLRMLRSPTIESAAVPERVPCVQVIEGDDGRPYKDASDAEVLVLGDSFLRIYQRDEPGAAGFVAHLARGLRQPLTSLVADGGASTLVRQELFRRPALLTGKRVVVWEFVERDIRLGTEGWQHVPLPPESKAETGSRPAIAGG